MPNLEYREHHTDLDPWSRTQRLLLGTTETSSTEPLGYLQTHTNASGKPQASTIRNGFRKTDHKDS